jgi:hypothetical protein
VAAQLVASQEGLSSVSKYDKKLPHFDELIQVQQPPTLSLFTQLHLLLEFTPQDSTSHLHWVRGLFYGIALEFWG